MDGLGIGNVLLVALVSVPGFTAEEAEGKDAPPAPQQDSAPDRVAALHRRAEELFSSGDIEAALQCRRQLVAILGERHGEKDWRVTAARLEVGTLERYRDLRPEDRRCV